MLDDIKFYITVLVFTLGSLVTGCAIGSAVYYIFNAEINKQLQNSSP